MFTNVTKDKTADTRCTELLVFSSNNKFARDMCELRLKGVSICPITRFKCKTKGTEQEVKITLRVVIATAETRSY